MTNSVESSPYDRGAELVKCALEEMRAQDIPDTEVPPVLADFAIWAALRLGGTAGGEAILERLRREVTLWTLGKHPMQASMRANGERVPSSESVFGDPDFDLSALRIAMEHFLSHQHVDLEHAAAYFAIYAVGLVHQRLGYERAKVIINTTKHELKRLEAESDQADN